jgi:hypothetical protein
MLIECPECKHQISDSALSCPNCGKPNNLQPVAISNAAEKSPEQTTVKGSTGSEPPAAASFEIADLRKMPGFAVAAGIVFVFCLFTPRILLTLPAAACVVLAVVSVVRKENPRWLSIVIGVMAIALVIMNSAELSSIQRQFQTAGSDTPGTVAVARNLNWQYQSSKDEMRGTVSKWATIDSETELALNPPYDGANVASLMVDKSGGAILSVTKGQLLCRYENGTVTIKFDNGPVWNYPCSSPTNGDSTTLYIQSQYDAADGQPKDPLDGLAKADTVTIEVELYSNGLRQLTFHVAGLDRSKL